MQKKKINKKTYDELKQKLKDAEKKIAEQRI